MIKGEISPFSTAVIPLRIKAYDGRTFEVEATVDTGFSGYLTLPSEDIVLLGLPFEQDDIYIVGRGLTESFATYRATVLWDGQERDVSVLATDSGTLIGMKMLRGYRFRMTVVDGGEVEIEAVA